MVPLVVAVLLSGIVKRQLKRPTDRKDGESCLVIRSGRVCSVRSPGRLSGRSQICVSTVRVSDGQSMCSRATKGVSSPRQPGTFIGPKLGPGGSVAVDARPRPRPSSLIPYWMSSLVRQTHHTRQGRKTVLNVMLEDMTMV